MKSFITKCVCLHFQLYKIGLMIAIIYIIFNVLIIWSILSRGDDDYAVVLLCSLTVMTSSILIYGLATNRHTLLLPWLSNVTILILCNIFAVIAQFDEASRLVSRVSFYLAFGSFMALELQVLSWYTIFTLFKIGHRKSFRVGEFVPRKPPIKRIEDKDTFKIYLVGTDNLGKTDKI